MEISNTSETISDNGNEVSIFSQRGGIITSIKIKAVEILYQDMYEETLLDYSKSVKWWIPYMFPNAWPLNANEKESSWLDLPQHWIWRINQWTKLDSSKKWEYVQEFRFEKSKDYPFNWTVKNTTKLLDDWVEIMHEIENKSVKNMPISTWLHPYFRIPEWKKEEIQFNFIWWKEVEKLVNIWSNDGTITFENPWKPFKVNIPWLWTLTIEVSSQYKKFWVRSLPWKDFICIEPVMWNEWAIANNPVIVEPWSTNVNYMKIFLNAETSK